MCEERCRVCVSGGECLCAVRGRGKVALEDNEEGREGQQE